VIAVGAVVHLVLCVEFRVVSEQVADDASVIVSYSDM